MTPAGQGLLARLVETARNATQARLDIRMGPVPVCLRAGSSQRLTRLAAALSASEGSPWLPLEVAVVTSDELDVSLLPEAIRPGGNEVRVAYEGRQTALTNGSDETLWLLDAATGTAVLWVADFEALPLWEHTSPLRTAARWWAATQGAALVHTGALADDSGAVLLVGDSGAGKSTATMACFGTGLDVLGDDFCFVQPPGPDGAPPLAHALYRLAKLDDQALDLLPHLRERVVGTAWRGKKLIDLRSDSVAPKPVRAICHVVRDPGGPTRTEPMSRAQTLRAVAPSTMFQQRLWERETWNALAATVRTTPCYRLLVDSPGDVADTVRGVLA